MCEHGTTVPMPIGGRVCDVDACLALVVATLNTIPALATTACCCGHGHMPGSVLLADGRALVLMTRAEHDAYFATFTTDIHGLPRAVSAGAERKEVPDAD